jgi:hypothetical protein
MNYAFQRPLPEALMYYAGQRLLRGNPMRYACRRLHSGALLHNFSRPKKLSRFNRDLLRDGPMQISKHYQYKIEYNKKYKRNLDENDQK